RIPAPKLVPIPRVAALLVALVAALTLGLSAAEASPCKGTGQTCPTNQSCCSRRCVKNVGAKFGTCRPACRCGDGVSDPSCGEQCDDGNTASCDGCSPTCQNESCGDGTVCASQGETCDPPGSPAGAHGYACRTDCTVCGDGVRQDGEVCDDGNTNNFDSCNN